MSLWLSLSLQVSGGGLTTMLSGATGWLSYFITIFYQSRMRFLSRALTCRIKLFGCVPSHYRNRSTDLVDLVYVSVQLELDGCGIVGVAPCWL